MMAQQRRSPAGQGRGFGKAQTLGDGLHRKNTTPAPVRAFKRELWVILNAADRMAAGYGLAWDDYDRLHQAHQHVLRVLEAVNE
jgi:hypothetical protein